MRHVVGRSVAVLAGLAGYARLVAGQTPDQDAVRQVIEAIAEFSQAKNLAAMDTLYAPGGGVHIIEGAGVNHGWVDYRDNHLGRELAEFQNFKYRHYAIEPTVRGTVAWTSFRYELAMDTQNGHVEVEGRGTAVLEKRDGRWVIVHQHTSGRRKQPQ
ncbi:MAG TPA: nuclear transport factor 2 family protein [Gemmatimonadales bacterium]|nr:nuclear transport factor 2 family protein [Gemmatimonadales bacterium]